LVTPLIGVLIGSFILGAIYSLMAMGLSMLWSTLGLANFAHGAILVLGAYSALFFYETTGFLPSILLAIPFVFLVGVACDKAIFKRARYAADAPLRLVLITIALALVIEQALNLVFGGTYERIPEVVSGGVDIGNVTIFNQYILAFVVAMSTLVVIYLVMYHTKIGLGIRAVGQDIQESLVAGINVEFVYSMTVGVGFTLAAIAGILLGSMYVFNPTFGRAPLLLGYVIVVLGGVGSYKGTVVASFLVAATYALTIYFIGGAWSIAVPFVLMILILALRPYGLFGTRGGTR
jgi:branched-chain amino acid transport system permease protein